MNWQTIITELTDRAHGGITQVALSKKCGCGQSTISEIARGVILTPNANLGLKLVELHAELVKERRNTP
jgi:hypothetical protein